MPRVNKYVIEVRDLKPSPPNKSVWYPSLNFEHRVSGNSFKSRVAAERALKKYGSKAKFLEYRIVPKRKDKTR